MKPKVLLCTSISENKMYTELFLPKVAKSLNVSDIFMISEGQNNLEKFPESFKIFSIDLDNSLTRIARIAAIRNKSRELFLSGDWTHLFFLDSDIVPPKTIVEDLLKYEAYIASGIYTLRDFSQLSCPVLMSSDDENIIPYVVGADYIKREVVGFGFGCMLVSRKALEAVSFRDGAGLEEWGEDYGFCVDTINEFNTVLYIDYESSCWHVDNDYRAGRLIVDKEKDGVCWQDFPYQITNEFGSWTRGRVRYDLSDDKISRLGSGFIVKKYRGLSLEVKNVKEI